MSSQQLRDAAQRGQASPPPKSFPAMLTAYKDQVAAALPRHMDPERMVRIGVTAYRQTPLLTRCDPASVFGAVIQSAQLGLEVGLLGEAYLVPFKTRKKDGGQWVETYECQLIPGYQGLMKLARNSGQIKDIYAHEVRENDEFELELGSERRLRHRPLMRHGFPAPDDERGEITGFYAVAVFKDGTFTFEAMNLQSVERIRDRSNGWKAAVASAKRKGKENTSPWATDFVPMGCKTAIRKLCKSLPRSPELQSALSLDDDAQRGRRQNHALDSIIEGEYQPLPEGEQPDDDAPDDEPPEDDAQAAAAGEDEPKGDGGGTAAAPPAATNGGATQQAMSVE